jgi:hypothetical protein
MRFVYVIVVGTGAAAPPVPQDAHVTTIVNGFANLTALEVPTLLGKILGAEVALTNCLSRKQVGLLMGTVTAGIAVADRRQGAEIGLATATQ